MAAYYLLHVPARLAARKEQRRRAAIAQLLNLLPALNRQTPSFPLSRSLVPSVLVHLRVVRLGLPPNLPIEWFSVPRLLYPFPITFPPALLPCQRFSVHHI